VCRTYICRPGVSNLVCRTLLWCVTSDLGVSHVGCVVLPHLVYPDCDQERQLRLINMLAPWQRRRLHEGEPPLDLLVSWRRGELEFLDERDQDRFYGEGRGVRLGWGERARRRAGATH
jgi:hypothetical protein